MWVHCDKICILVCRPIFFCNETLEYQSHCPDTPDLHISSIAISFLLQYVRMMASSRAIITQCYAISPPLYYLQYHIHQQTAHFHHSHTYYYMNDILPIHPSSTRQTSKKWFRLQTLLTIQFHTCY